MGGIGILWIKICVNPRTERCIFMIIFPEVRNAGEVLGA